MNEEEIVQNIAALLFAETKDVDDAKGVGSVILNRLKRPDRFGKDVMSVMSAEDKDGVKQFTGYGSKEWEKVFNKELRNEEEEKILKSLIPIARQVYNGNLKDVTGGADHYYNPERADPYWAKYNKPRYNKDGLSEMYYPEVYDSGIHKYFKETLSPKRKSKR